VEDVVDGFAFVKEDTRLGFHGGDFDSANGGEVAEAAVGDGADAAGAAAEEAPEGSFDDGGGIAAELPALPAGLGFERAEADAGFADGDAVGRDVFDPVEELEVEDDAAMEGNGLAVVAGACAAEGDGDFVREAEAEDGDDFGGGDGLDDDVGVLAIEQRAKDGRVPVEVAGETLDDLRLREDARGIGEE
jgi:hypothetical protein